MQIELAIINHLWCKPHAGNCKSSP